MLANDALKLGVGEQETLRHIFRRVISRYPNDEEAIILLDALNRTRRQFQVKPEAADRLMKIGQTQIVDNANSVELASWTSLCLAVFNLDEALTRQ